MVSFDLFLNGFVLDVLNDDLEKFRDELDV